MYGIKHCVVPAENIHTTPTEGICHMTPPPLWIFQNQPVKLRVADFIYEKIVTQKMMC